MEYGKKKTKCEVDDILVSEHRKCARCQILLGKRHMYKSQTTECEDCQRQKRVIKMKCCNCFKPMENTAQIHAVRGNYCIKCNSKLNELLKTPTEDVEEELETMRTNLAKI